MRGNNRCCVFLLIGLTCVSIGIFLIWKRQSHTVTPIREIRFQRPDKTRAAMPPTTTSKPHSLLLRMKSKLVKDRTSDIVFPYEIPNPLVKFPAANEVVYAKLKSTIPCLTAKCGMYTHNFHDHVSNKIKKNGVWEEKITNVFTTVLNYFPNAKFIDIGSNIGYYTMVASQMNRFCFAIEANPKNAAVLAKSIIDNQLTKRVKLLNKAVGQYSGQTISLATEKGNMGNTIVQKNNSTKILDYNGKVNPNIQKTQYRNIPTITLDDVTDKYLANFHIAVVKMDVQGAEYEALASASKLFSKVYIPAVFFEWVNYQFAIHHKEAAEIAQFFLTRGYKPYNPENDQALPLDHKSWTYDVLFMLD